MNVSYESWASSDAVRRSMLANRSRDTRPERALRSLLHARGLRYRVCVRPLGGVRRSADVVFTRARVAVFVDGCFWHGCPEHFRAPKTNAAYWQDKIDRNRARDQDTDAQLAQAGWSVVRVWEHDEPQEAAQRVSEAVARARRREVGPVA